MKAFQVVEEGPCPLTTLSEDEDDATDAQNATIKKWEQDDYLCKGHLLNAMADSMLDVYQQMETTKELWDTLEEKYKIEDFGERSFLVNKYLDFRFSDGKPILDQVDEVHNYLAQICQLGITSDTFHINAIIHKLPNIWKDYKKSLEHDTKGNSPEMLCHHLRVEEELHLQDKKDEQKDITFKAHMVESCDQNKGLKA